MQKQEYKVQQSYQEVSRANLIALAENVWHLMMSAIFGANSLECFGKLGPDGLWDRTFQGYSQVKMDGFSDKFSGTWPKQGVMYGGTVFQPTLPVHHFGANGLRLWPRPIASDGLAWRLTNAKNPRISIIKIWERHGSDRPIYDFLWHGMSATQAAEYTGMMMGFPPHWTDLNATETPSCHSSSTQSLGQ